MLRLWHDGQRDPWRGKEVTFTSAVNSSHFVYMSHPGLFSDENNPLSHIFDDSEEKNWQFFSSLSSKICSNPLGVGWGAV